MSTEEERMTWNPEGRPGSQTGGRVRGPQTRLRARKRTDSESFDLGGSREGASGGLGSRGLSVLGQEAGSQPDTRPFPVGQALLVFRPQKGPHHALLSP